MPSTAHSRIAALAAMACGLLAVALPACGSDGASSSSGSYGQSASACEEDTRKDVYVAGMQKQASAFSVKILESTPAPPAKSQNKLMLQLLTADGQPLPKATIAVTPYMPDHAHGSAVMPIVTDNGDGTYLVDKIYYPMAGLWRLTITVTPPNASPQDVAFQFCLDG